MNQRTQDRIIREDPSFDSKKLEMLISACPKFDWHGQIARCDAYMGKGAAALVVQTVYRIVGSMSVLQITQGQYEKELDRLFKPKCMSFLVNLEKELLAAGRPRPTDDEIDKLEPILEGVRDRSLAFKTSHIWIFDQICELTTGENGAEWNVELIANPDRTLGLLVHNYLSGQRRVLLQTRITTVVPSIPSYMAEALARYIDHEGYIDVVTTSTNDKLAITLSGIMNQMIHGPE